MIMRTTQLQHLPLDMQKLEDIKAFCPIEGKIAFQAQDKPPHSHLVIIAVISEMIGIHTSMVQIEDILKT